MCLLRKHVNFLNFIQANTLQNNELWTLLFSVSCHYVEISDFSTGSVIVRTCTGDDYF